jgi:hypothetical protein
MTPASHPMTGRILCRVGLHHWTPVEFVFGGWLECARCLRRKL